MLKILINTPDLKRVHGGVTNHYNGLKPYWKENVKYNIIGKRSNTNTGGGIWWLPFDIIKFVLKLTIWRPDLVLLNPSFNRSAIVRDLIFLRISTFFKFKTAVMFHGWTQNYVDSINKNKIAGILNNTSGIFVLADNFKKQLESWGVSVPIYLTTTKVSDELIANFDIESRNGEIKNILFLSRVEKAKGIYEAIDTFKLLISKYPHLKFSIVGDGTEYCNVKDYVKKNTINNINFTGNINGNELIRAFTDADLYIFPSYSEGMPTSVLEAMAFGLPIITRPVGGLVDFFEDNKMGFIVSSKEPKDFYDKIEKLLENSMLTKEISEYNHKYAIEKFLASSVAKNMETIFHEIINK